ncbi:ras guanine nucleotide exchange factor G-like [Vespula squamosa]|uniref:Ras guanine nucleotide exchange factor G-like n=1 Tax=Vespula squamosa TaxID=30214 RepID=A0ABD2AEI6_VESSQ
MSNALPSRGLVNGENNELGAIAAAATAAPSVFPGRSGGGDAADIVFNGCSSGGGSGGGGGGGAGGGNGGRSSGERGEERGGSGGYVVTVSTDEGVVGVVDLHDANLDPRVTPVNFPEIRSSRDASTPAHDCYVDGNINTAPEYREVCSLTNVSTSLGLDGGITTNTVTATATATTTTTTTITTTATATAIAAITTNIIATATITIETSTIATTKTTTTTTTTTALRVATYDNDNMVAAMNEHLSTSSATSGARTSASTTTTTTSNVATSNNNNNNNNNNSSCPRNEFQSNVDEESKSVAGILSFPCDFDHMYASMTDGGTPAAATATSALGVSPLRGNEPRQNDLTEVKHLKELLLLHLDLIQQQSEQIVTKDKLLAALRQENETLKLRLERMDRRVNLQKLRSESSENSILSEHIGACSPPSLNSVTIPSTSDIHKSIQSESSNTQYNESFKIRLNTSGGITTVKQECNDNQGKHEKQDIGNESRLEWEEKKKRRSDPTPLSGGIKRKRGVSCSSTISNDTTSTIQDKQLSHESSRKTDRKGKSLVRKESFLTTEEHYYTAVGDPNYTLSLKESSPPDINTTLEVPNWRVKVYTSCYTMEGTENLDDEIFNKRHLKLENDERRRKRWDVQRIREQRHIEKLKQRQERQNHQATCYNTNHTGPCPSSMEEEAVTSLWPDVEQIQSLQVDHQLPVTAFGAPIPSFTPSEFSLPWTHMVLTKSRCPKRSTGRRKTSRR